MNGKIKLKFGSIEAECEGSEEFLKGEFLEMLKAVSQLAVNLPPTPDAGVSATNPGSGGGGAQILKSTSSIATALGVNTGPELAVAACGKLELGDNRSEYSQKDILGEMKLATAYYKKTYRNNLTQYVLSLVKAKKINQLGEDKFALQAAFKKQLAGQLKV